MNDLSFQHFTQKYLEEEVTIITKQGTYDGRLLDVGTDVLVIENRRGPRPLKLIIRIGEIVVIHLSELTPIRAFGFMPPMGEMEEHVENLDKH